MEYLTCKHLRRKKPSLEVDRDKAEDIAKSYRVLPIYEKILHEDVYTQHYSLETNEFLRCRWDEYKEKGATRVHEPFRFFDDRDVHFYLSKVRLVPSESVHNKTQFRKTLNAENRVDERGPKPLPHEVQVRKYSLLSRKYPKRYPKNAEDDKKNN